MKYGIKRYMFLFKIIEYKKVFFLCYNREKLKEKVYPLKRSEK